MLLCSVLVMKGKTCSVLEVGGAEFRVGFHWRMYTKLAKLGVS